MSFATKFINLVCHWAWLCNNRNFCLKLLFLIFCVIHIGGRNMFLTVWIPFPNISYIKSRKTYFDGHTNIHIV